MNTMNKTIAISLEHSIAFQLNLSKEKIQSTMFNSDCIISNHFYDTMVLLLVLKCNNYEVAQEFSDKYMEYENVNMEKIPENIVKQMYHEFESILKKEA